MPHVPRVSTLRIAAVVALAPLFGCADTVARYIQPYKVEIQQGNFISREQVSALRQGMTRDQVRFVLGTPMLAPMFKGDRWDYLFYIRRTSGLVVERKLTVWFDKDERLDHWVGDEMPIERPHDVEVAAPAPETAPKPADVTPDPPQPAEPAAPGPNS